MQACSTHVQDGSDPKRTGSAPPEAQGPRGRPGQVAVRLPPGRAETDRRAAHARRNACAASRPGAPDADRPRGRGPPPRARVRVIVVDASAMTEWLLQTELGSRVEDRLVRDGDAFHAPHLIDAEVVQALRRLVRTGDVSAPRAGEAVNDLTLLEVTRH